jgi:SAM-dependent methyltransferase
MDADDWDRRYAATEMVWSATPNVFFAEAVEGRDPGRALDLGAGEGRNAIWLAENGWDVTAVDFSAVAIDKGRRLAADHGVDVRWLVEDLTSWSPPVTAFDLVGVIYVHFPDGQRRALVQASLAAVAPGGTWVWVGHDADNIERGYGGPQDPAVLATVGELVVALDPADWEVIRAEQVLRTVAIEDGHGEGPSGSATAIDQLVVAHRRS